MVNTIKIGMATCGLAAGAQKTYDKLVQLITNKNLDYEVKKVGCIGMCYNEPLIEFIIDNKSYTYKNITQDKVELLINNILNKKYKNNMLEYTENVKISGVPEKSNHAFFRDQVKIITDNCGIIEPLSLEEYKQRNGFSGLKKAFNLKPEEIISIIEKSKLRGRGGAGFPTAMKWKFIASKQGEKFLVCNFDEGDPGAFMNRSLVEGDPYKLIEGMVIAAYTIKASKGFIYVRAEYPLALKTLRKALDICRENNYLGSNILGTGFNFNIEIKLGAGAYVCGEETALIESIQGNRGNPRAKPPFPSDKGLWNKPTNINNVGTFAHVTKILQDGVDEYIKYGTEKSKGTKVISLTGKVKRTGMIEVPLGIKLRKIVFDIGGGTTKKFKAVQIGGPSGGCLPESELDLGLDYDTIIEKGAIMGSGGIVVMDTDTDMVSVAKFFVNFSTEESCGKCTPCREGTKVMLYYLTKILNKDATLAEYKELKKLCPVIKDTALCGLGQASPNPVLSTIKYFEKEYLTKLKDVKRLTQYTINDKCIRCGICKIDCPVNAITGKKGEKHFIDQHKCTHCGLCYSKCKFKAIDKKKLL